MYIWIYLELMACRFVIDIHSVRNLIKTMDYHIRSVELYVRIYSTIAHDLVFGFRRFHSLVRNVRVDLTAFQFYDAFWRGNQLLKHGSDIYYSRCDCRLYVICIVHCVVLMPHRYIIKFYYRTVHIASEAANKSNFQNNNQKWLLQCQSSIWASWYEQIG